MTKKTPGRVPAVKPRKSPFDHRQPPPVAMNADGDMMANTPEPGPFFDPSKDYTNGGKPVFDYHKTRAGLNERFALHMEPVSRTMVIEDLTMRGDYLKINDTDTEIGMVVRDALVSYHLEKLRAKHNG